MNIIRRTIGAVALAAVAAVGYGDDAVVCAGAERTVEGTGEIAQCALDLSEAWDKRDVSDEPILWSSLGWEDEAEPEGGKTVTLRLIPLSTGEEQTLASGLTGHRQTFYWALGEVSKLVYNIRHVVVGGSPLEELNAYFSFEHYDDVPPSEADVRAAIRSGDGTGWDFGIVNDPDNWWSLAGGPGEGIEAPPGESALTFTVDGHGIFAFDYALEGGQWTVRVDGVVVRTMDGAADWTGAELPMDGRLVTHVIEFVTELSDGGRAALRNVRWVDADDRFGGGRAGGGAADLREGALVVRRASELMPFTWSSTNFTGNVLVRNTGFVTVDPRSVAHVRVVQVTGEGEDVSQWTAEVAGTERTLVAEKQGEGTVKWRGAKAGVWKAEFTVGTDGGEACRETRILDLRNYIGPGMVLFVM